MKGNLSRIYFTDMGSILITHLVRSMKVIGRKVHAQEKEKNILMMGQFMKEIT